MSVKTPPLSSARDIFLAALEKSTPERERFVEAECEGNSALRRQVEELLREHEQIGSFLQTPALQNAPDLSRTIAIASEGMGLLATTIEKPGDRIGRYKLLEKIGEGGCGVVYMAEQEEPVRRRVALKIIKLGMDTRSVIARFEAERQALAMMDHPNIAKVLDGGATETGRPYFVMELVRGVRITEYCDQNNVPPRERLKLFIDVCLALQHAHQKGIIHRDIKPSNILVTLHDGRPVPKVIDFGIAKATEQRLTDKTVFTAFTMFIGTPAYMSPEQAEMSGLDIDTRSDVYSLGVLLYELLTGKTPFDAEKLMRNGLDECRRTIREQDPMPPSTRLTQDLIAADLRGLKATDAEEEIRASSRRLQAKEFVRIIRGDLDWIVMKCLEKDRTRRYATANDLALDVQRYLKGEAVLARPPSNVYLLEKFVQRHRGVFAAAAAVAATLIIGAILSTWQAFRATRAEHLAVASQKQESVLRLQAQQQRIRAEQEEALARLNEYVADVNLAHQQLVSAGNYGRAVKLLNKHRPRDGESDRRGFEWRYLWQLSRGDEHVALPTQEGSVRSITISPSGDFLAVALRNKVNVINVQSRSLVTSLPRGAESLAFLPDGKTLVTATFFPPGVHIWNTADWTQQNALSGSSAPISVSRDGQRLATTSRAGVRIWDTASWRQLELLTNVASALAFSPDSSMLATDTREGALALWPLANNIAPKVLVDSTNMFGRWFRNDRTLAFSPDGQFVVTPRNALSDRGVFVLSVWDTRSGKEVGVMPASPEYVEHTGGILSLAFSPDGHTLATASSDYSIRLWDFTKRQRMATLQGHLAEVTAVAFSPDGKSIISGAEDGGLKLWTTRRPQTEDVLPGSLLPLAFSPDSRTLAGLSRQGAVVFLDLTSRERLQEVPLEKIRFGPFASVAISRDLGTLAQGLPDGKVKLWNINSGENKTLATPHRQVELVELSPDARILITGGRSRSLQWWDLRNATNGPLGADIPKVVFSPDGRVLAAFQRGNNVQLLKVESSDAAIQFQPLTEFSIDPSTRSSQEPGRQGPFSSATAFSADSRLLAIACQDDVVRVWEVATGKLAGAYSGHKQNVFSVAFSPDGKTLATASEDSTLRLWNIATQQEMLTIRRLGGTLRGLMFSPDGQLLVGASGFVSQSPYGGLRLYHAPILSDLSAEAAAHE